jgi:hypothetical protein
MEKVNIDTIKPWIGKRVTELLGTDDDVLLEFIVNMLEKEKVDIRYTVYIILYIRLQSRYDSRPRI